MRRSVPGGPKTTSYTEVAKRDVVFSPDTGSEAAIRRCAVLRREVDWQENRLASRERCSCMCIRLGKGFEARW